MQTAETIASREPIEVPIHALITLLNNTLPHIESMTPEEIEDIEMSAQALHDVLSQDTTAIGKETLAGLLTALRRFSNNVGHAHIAMVDRGAPMTDLILLLETINKELENPPLSEAEAQELKALLMMQVDATVDMNEYRRIMDAEALSQEDQQILERIQLICSYGSFDSKEQSLMRKLANNEPLSEAERDALPGGKLEARYEAARLQALRKRPMPTRQMVQDPANG